MLAPPWMRIEPQDRRVPTPTQGGAGHEAHSQNTYLCKSQGVPWPPICAGTLIVLYIVFLYRCGKLYPVLSDSMSTVAIEQ